MIKNPKFEILIFGLFGRRWKRRIDSNMKWKVPLILHKNLYVFLLFFATQHWGPFRPASPVNPHQADVSESLIKGLWGDKGRPSFGPGQTWKKLQAVQAALADILSEITLFWGHFESNILYFWERMEKEELPIEN